MTDGVDLIARLLAGVSIIGTMVLSLAVNLRAADRRRREEAAALRAALESELAILQAVYGACLRQLQLDREVVSSCRHVNQVYRGSLGRLHLLGADVAAAVTQAYAFIEAIETFLAGTCRPQGTQAWRVLAGEAPLAEVVALYEEGAARVTLALSVLRHLPAR